MSQRETQMDRESGRHRLRERNREGERGIVTCCGFYKHTQDTGQRGLLQPHYSRKKKLLQPVVLMCLERERERGWDAVVVTMEAMSLGPGFSCNECQQRWSFRMWAAQAHRRYKTSVNGSGRETP